MKGYIKTCKEESKRYRMDLNENKKEDKKCSENRRYQRRLMWRGDIKRNVKKRAKYIGWTVIEKEDKKCCVNYVIKRDKCEEEPFKEI